MKRECRYVPLSKQPLILVLCEIKISPVRKIADYIPAIQEAFRRHGYPIERSGKIQQVSISPNGVQATEQERWEYRTKAEDWSIIVLQDSIVLQTTAYERFEKFAEQLQLATSIVFKNTEHDQFGRVHRIGLRYIDLVQPKDGENFRKYLRSGFHGLSEDVFKNGTARTRVECAGQTDVDGEVGTMVVRIAQNDQGMDLPPDLVGSAPKRRERVQKGDLVTFIDLDHYLDGNFDPSLDWIEKSTYLLHDQIIETFHDHVITEEAELGDKDD